MVALGSFRAIEGKAPSSGDLLRFYTHPDGQFWKLVKDINLFNVITNQTLGSFASTTSTSFVIYLSQSVNIQEGDILFASASTNLGSSGGIVSAQFLFNGSHVDFGQFEYPFIPAGVYSDGVFTNVEKSFLRKFNTALGSVPIEVRFKVTSGTGFANYGRIFSAIIRAS